VVVANGVRSQLDSVQHKGQLAVVVEHLVTILEQGLEVAAPGMAMIRLRVAHGAGVVLAWRAGSCPAQTWTGRARCDSEKSVAT
jgi:hypothetical protein